VRGLDDDRLRLGPIVAIGAGADRREGDRRADLVGERGQRLKPRRELVAVDLGRHRRVQGRRLGRRRQLVDLRPVEDRGEAKERPRLLGRVGACVAPSLEPGLRRRARCEDPQRLLAAANAVAERQPGLEAGDARGVGILHRQEELISERVGVEMPARGQPALPALGAAQLLDGLLDERAVGGAALLALGLGQLGALGHRGCSSR
jgi:hypothetical protein